MPVSQDVFAAAREQVGPWIGWVPLAAWLAVAFATGFTGTALGARVALRRARRSPPDLHWTERARLLWPFQSVATLAVLVAAVAGAGFAVGLAGPLSLLPRRAFLALAGLSGSLGALIACGRAPRGLLDELSWRQYALTTVSLWLLFLPHLLVTALALLLVPLEWGLAAAGVIAAAALVLLAVLAGAHVALLRRVGLVRPASPEVARVAADCAVLAGAAPPRVYVLHAHTANAMVILLPRILLVTRRLIEELGDEELRAVLLHEAGHLAEPRGVVWLHTARVLSVVLLVAAFPLGLTWGWPGGAAPVAAVLAFLLLSRPLGRALETRADAVALEHDVDPAVYARALEAIHRLNHAPAVMPGRGLAHPHLYDRLLAAGVAPDFRRPDPPPRGPAVAAKLVATLVLFAPGIALTAWRALELQLAWHRDGVPTAALALSGGEPWTLLLAAEELRAAGDGAGARALARAAREADPGALAYVLRLGQLWAALGERELLALDYAAARARAGGRAELGAYVLVELGKLAAELGRADEAGAYRDRALELHERDHERDPWLKVHLARLERDLGRPEESARWLERARATARANGVVDELEELVAREL